MNGFLLVAAILSLITFLAHLFWGGQDIVNPLLEAPDLQEMPKLTAYYCWHITTLMLFIMSCAYIYVALVQLDFPLTVAMTCIAAACALLSIGLILVRKLKPLDYPQWLFFIPISFFGVLGILI